MQSVHVIGDFRCPPHHAVRMILRGSCSRVMVRQMKVPKNFPAVLPYGPAAPPQDEPFYTAVEDTGIGINQLGMMMYDSLERNLADVVGLSGKELEAHSGRSLGPKFVWKDLYAGER